MCNFYNVTASLAFNSVIINSGVLLVTQKSHYELFFGSHTPYKEHETPINGHLQGGKNVRPKFSFALNSGFVSNAIKSPPLRLALLVPDQGYFNAMLHLSLHAFPTQLYDLGFKYNYIGSFENVNKKRVSFRSKDAYIVHATTGVLLVGVVHGEGYDRYKLAEGMEVVTIRTDYLSGVDELWKKSNR